MSPTVTPLTQEEFEFSLRTIMNEYFTPIFQIIGAGIALLVLCFAIALIVTPFIRRM